MIEDNLARINSIAQVHRLLTGELKDEVEISGMLNEIGRSTILANGGGNIEMHVEGPQIRVPAGKATSLAIVINELVINSIKHGFAGGKREGEISITLKPVGDTMEIIYMDTGAGSESSGTQGSGLGTQIIDSLIKDDLAGSWYATLDAGYKAVIRFPLPA